MHALFQVLAPGGAFRIQDSSVVRYIAIFSILLLCALAYHSFNWTRVEVDQAGFCQASSLEFIIV